jgi:hypothetical protein
MRSKKFGQPSLAVLFALFIVVAMGSTAQAEKLFVANTGVDNAVCGGKKSPCRSISQAIQNASPGDKVIVGPGFYGDLDDDGTFGELGEEDAQIGSGCFCMIRVDKPLTIESSNGAAATVLSAGGAFISAVRIDLGAGGTLFGKKKKGFTLTGGTFGLVTDSSISGVRVTGNLSHSNSGSGFLINGSNHLVTGNIATGNSSEGFSFGFSGSGQVFANNVATANDGSGFFFAGTAHVLIGNVASDNDDNGFAFGGSSHLLQGNSAVGNVKFGINIIGGTLSATIIKNNIFGNQRELVLGFINCGLLNQSDNVFSVPNNFWGAATGPSNVEPADNFCNSGAGDILVPSFATKAFKIKVKVLEELPNESAVIEPSRLPVSEESFDLRLYTLAGQLVARVSDETQLALAKQSLANGVYLAEKVYADGRREIVKFALRH